MKNLKKLTKFILGVIGITILHIALTLILPNPFSAFNALFCILSLLILSRGLGYVVWVAFFTHFIIELYAVTPFGITLVSSTIAILFTLWIYRYLFTNKSWYTAGTLVVVSLLFYRLIFSILALIHQSIFGAELLVLSKAVRSFGLEILITSIATIIIYLVLSKIIPTLSKQKVKRSWFKTLNS